MFGPPLVAGALMATWWNPPGWPLALAILVGGLCGGGVAWRRSPRGRGRGARAPWLLLGVAAGALLVLAYPLALPLTAGVWLARQARTTTARVLLGTAAVCYVLAAEFAAFVIGGSSALIGAPFNIVAGVLLGILLLFGTTLVHGVTWWRVRAAA